MAVAATFDWELVIIDVSTLDIKELHGVAGGAYEFSHGLLPAHPRVQDEDGLEGYVDRTGAFVVEPQFADAYPFDRCGAIVKVGREDRTKRRINHRGEPIGERYLDIRVFHPEGLYSGANIAWGERGMIIIDGYGEHASNRAFDVVWQEHEGLIPVQFEWGLVGWVTPDGKDVYQLRADGVGSCFQNGLVPVEELDGKWGLMDVEGQWVVDPKFDIAEPSGPRRFALGHLDAQERPHVRLADSSGRFLGEHEFLAIGGFVEGIAQVWRARDGSEEDAMESNFIDLNGRLLVTEWA
ncbi:MAG: WG repeat-containing protein [Planctomycetota bacterium]